MCVYIGLRNETCNNPDTTLYYISGSYGFGYADLAIKEYCYEHSRNHRFDYPDYCFNTREEAELRLITEQLFGETP